MAYTLIALLLAYAAAYITVVYLGPASMGRAIFLILAGFALAGASAFTAAYSRWWGERGGRLVTAALRNLLGIPLFIAGYAFAWLAPSPFLLSPGETLRDIGIALIVLGLVPVMWAHMELGPRAHMPSVKDTIVRHGLYARVRHPVYAGGFLIIAGLALLRPTQALVSACALGLIGFVVQARLEEKDLLQRMPDYREYMKRVPRFIPRLRK
jgi:protein-S-isoprenylcysteine O-methyltransferase Ste14